MAVAEKPQLDLNSMLAGPDEMGRFDKDVSSCRPLALSSASLKPILWDSGREDDRRGVASQPTKVSFHANKNRWITETVDGASYRTGHDLADGALSSWRAFKSELRTRLRDGSTCSRADLEKRLPVVQWLPRYAKQDLVHDALAGITVGLTTVPQALAYAGVAGLRTQEKHKNKVNASGMRYPINVCGKTRMDRVSNEWLLKECSLKGNPIGQYERRVLRWFRHGARMSVDRYGLYSSLVGPFIYVFLGGSKDITIGPTAILALMTRTFVSNHGEDFAVLLAFLSGCVISLLGLLRMVSNGVPVHTGLVVSNRVPVHTGLVVSNVVPVHIGLVASNVVPVRTELVVSNGVPVQVL
uniref:SLC26A/SulP transporter domain-containing protein n=1 Tax=Timema monikensis TaxID=170555 RepID=A0A7R9EET3_9NEOP|nr:unnamed protein product [Timema monikensis]